MKLRVNACVKETLEFDIVGGGVLRYRVQLCVLEVARLQYYGRGTPFLLFYLSWFDEDVP